MRRLLGFIVVMLTAGVAVSGPYLGLTPPDNVPQPFVAATIAPDHSVPVFAPDRVEVFWAQRAGSDNLRRIYRSYRSASGWSPAQVTPFTSVWGGDTPQFSPDGQTLFFTSTRPLASEGGRRLERLWMVLRTETGWSSPRPLPAAINGDHLHWQASIDAAENLYFGSERLGSQGRDDIFVCRRTGSGYRPAQSLPPPVNTSCHESTPFVAPDGDYLLFARSCYGDESSDIPRGLLVTFRLSDGGWSEPVPVPLLGVSTEDAVCPTVTPDGRFLFFLILNRDQQQTYWVDTSVIHDVDPRGEVARARKEP